MTKYEEEFRKKIEKEITEEFGKENKEPSIVCNEVYNPKGNNDEIYLKLVGEKPCNHVVIKIRLKDDNKVEEIPEKYKNMKIEPATLIKENKEKGYGSDSEVYGEHYAKLKKEGLIKEYLGEFLEEENKVKDKSEIIKVLEDLKEQLKLQKGYHAGNPKEMFSGLDKAMDVVSCVIGKEKKKEENKGKEKKKEENKGEDKKIGRDYVISEMLKEQENIINTNVLQSVKGICKTCYFYCFALRHMKEKEDNKGVI